MKGATIGQPRALSLRAGRKFSRASGRTARGTCAAANGTNGTNGANGNGAGQAWDKISLDELDAWKNDGPPTPLLDTVNYPVHIKNFNASQLKQFPSQSELNGG